MKMKGEARIAGSGQHRRCASPLSFWNRKHSSNLRSGENNGKIFPAAVQRCYAVIIPRYQSPISVQPPGEVGVFFLGHAGLDYMAAVGRVVSLGYGYHSFLCVVFRRGGLKKASCPFYYPHHKKSKIAKRFRKIFCGASRIAGFGEGTPQQDLPQGQNRRYADFGTVVESCSEKLPLSSVRLLLIPTKPQRGK